MEALPDHATYLDVEALSNETGNGLVHVSTPLLALSAVPLIALAGVSYRMELGLASSILIGAVRAMVQLSILGFILHPIFRLGLEDWWLVALYVLFMIVLAAFEATRRSKYHFPGIFLYILLMLLGNVALVSLFSFGIIIRPNPRWDPQYIIPIIGMLLGNSINGVALAINAITSALVEEADIIETYLAYGALSIEASLDMIRESVRVGAMPMINGLSVIGLISIPGMMTGQILGGSPVMEAARYQLLICYLIAMTSFGVILCGMGMAVTCLFDRQKEILKVDICHPRKEYRLWRIPGFLLFQRQHRYPNQELPSELQSVVSSDVSYHSTVSEHDLALSAPAKIDLVAIREGEKQSYPLLEIRNASRVVATESGVLDRVFQNISAKIFPGAIIAVVGPSGSGKSLLLKLVAGLCPMEPETDLILDGKPLLGNVGGRIMTARRWRRSVLYVSQHKVQLPQTPRDFLKRICSFHTWRQHGVENSPTFEAMVMSTLDLVQMYGLDETILDKEWKILSGGESQRVHVAIALASKPRILLLDESTNALDFDSKLEVEKSIVQAASMGVGILWVSHDEDQMNRLRSI